MEGNTVVFKYKGLYILGLFGELETPLERLTNLEDIVDDSMIHFSGVKTTQSPFGELNYLVAFNLSPPIDFTITRLSSDNSSSIFTFSLDKKCSRSLIEKMIQKTGFMPQQPPRDFIESIPINHRDKLVHYDLINDKYQDDTKKIENAFGFGHYISFLKTHLELPIEDSLRQTLEYFERPE